MRIPILKLHEYLLISVQVDLDDQTAMQFQEDLLSKIHESGATGVVLDLTSVDIIDSFIAKSIRRCRIDGRLNGGKSRLHWYSTGSFHDFNRHRHSLTRRTDSIRS